MEAALTLTEILAIVMFGEAGILHDTVATMAVGHVFMNRMDNGSFGDSPLEVAKGFNAFKVTSLDDVPDRYFGLAKIVAGVTNAYNMRGYDPTKGCLYIISHQDTYTIAGKLGDAFWLGLQADWISKSRVIDDVLYVLYAYKKFPGDIKRPAHLPRLTR